MHELAGIERDKALKQWRSATGADLVKYQTRYNAMQEMIDQIDKAPMEFQKQGD